ncbi:PREDICTED: long-chain-fatty-acid--CoA ligase 1-like [Acropora digitifera]|uniref:long-chain-fatty-acid--CoA ligase 1-like n=1 Tax=Acropora digitifera TaxID=70779 RepID=UPI00077A6661|nr:PREDICTED: long-chain-fatty-acid--CoA ligase 1-like [Acropora digitifera]
MVDYAAVEPILTYVREPAFIAAFGALALTTLYYFTSRPKPQPCPVDPERQSYELPGEDGARMNSLTTELVETLFDDVTTVHEAFMRGVRLSGNKPCLGYRSSPGGPYTWLTYNEMQWLRIVPLYDTLGPDACVYIINQARMTTVACDEGKLKIFLEQCTKCPTLKNVVKIGAKVTDEEKAAGDESGVNVIAFAELEVKRKIYFVFMFENVISLAIKYIYSHFQPPKPDDIAVVCYTSGTTGNPKGVMSTHKNITATLGSLVFIVEKCGITYSDAEVHLSYLPLAHMYERLAQVGIEIIKFIVPVASRFLCSLLLLFPNLGHVGPPLPCNKIKLVDVPDMDYYAKDGKGEICMYGPNVCKGYLYDEKKTKETIDEDGWLHSGDIGEWLPSGTLKIIDRKKNLFKLSQGEYIAPEKVETVYSQCPLVQQIFVYGDSRKSNLVAVVVPEPDNVKRWAEENSVQGDITSWCNDEEVKKVIFDEMTAEGKKERLRSFEQVRAISLTPELWTVENNLLTPTLKLKRQALKKLFEKTFEELYSALTE